MHPPRHLDPFLPGGNFFRRGLRVDDDCDDAAADDDAGALSRFEYVLTSLNSVSSTCVLTNAPRVSVIGAGSRPHELSVSRQWVSASSGPVLRPFPSPLQLPLVGAGVPHPCPRSGLAGAGKHTFQHTHLVGRD